MRGGGVQNVRMKMFLLMFVLALVASAQAPDLCGPQPAQVAPIVFRIPGTALSPVLGLGGDTIQVIIRTQNPKVVTARVTMTYLVEGQEIVAVSERPIPNGSDIHSFPVPSYQVPIISVTVKELAVLTDQMYTGF
jgi:hypothetical protein